MIAYWDREPVEVATTSTIDSESGELDIILDQEIRQETDIVEEAINLIKDSETVVRIVKGTF